MAGSSVKVGIIGGTGLDDPQLLENRTEKFVDTPFGLPSDALIFGKIKGVECVLLGRHGRKHDISPTNINYRANIWALKEAGCSVIVATTACGSLKDEIKPGHIVLLDQFIDRTTKRVSTYFDGGKNSLKGICHIPMAEPYCQHLRKVLQNGLTELGTEHHSKGTIVVAEGPRFSSRAESHMFRLFGASVISMTGVPEVVLAREAAIPYASMALVTDYDCYDESKEHVSVEVVMKQMKANAETCTKVLLHVIPLIAAVDWAPVHIKYQEVVKMSTMLAD